MPSLIMAKTVTLRLTSVSECAQAKQVSCNMHQEIELKELTN